MLSLSLFLPLVSRRGMRILECPLNGKEKSISLPLAFLPSYSKLVYSVKSVLIAFKEKKKSRKKHRDEKEEDVPR
jgi:hypothetical protein